MIDDFILPCLTLKPSNSRGAVVFSHFQSFEKVTAVVHSLGGRLALNCDADYSIGISPGLLKTLTPKQHELVKDLRDYRVHKSKYDLLNVLDTIPSKPLNKDSTMIIYGTRDVPEIITECEKLKSTGIQVTNIKDTTHEDIFVI